MFWWAGPHEQHKLGLVVYLKRERERKERHKAKRKCEGATQEKLEEGEGKYDQITWYTSAKFSKDNLKLILYVEIYRERWVSIEDINCQPLPSTCIST